ncbi:MAG: DUF362 domain-containing protein [Spirochaetota bacterium]|nr:DUF362 domain-containing protein [Spirochaetota bacterium]
MGKVGITKTDNGIKEGLIDALDLIGGLSNFVERNDRVMLKPNLNGVTGLTNIVLTESLLQLLLDCRVKKIIIAESTFGDKRNTDRLFKETGYAALAKRYGIELVNLNASEAIVTPVKNPLITDRVKIAKEVFEADKIINLPNMKVHYATGISLSLKNLKGFLVGREKRRFHEIGLDDAIVDLNNTIKPHLSIIDCISCMEGMGPFGGDIIDLNLIIAGVNSAEVDFIGSTVMGYELHEVRHLAKFIELNNIDLKKIQVIGERIETVRHPFTKVDFGNVIPEKITMHSRNACSTCENAFLLSCKFLEGIINTDIDVYIGSLHDEICKSAKYKIAFGNCCRSGSNFTAKIKGCPPLPFRLNECLNKFGVIGKDKDNHLGKG